MPRPAPLGSIPSTRERQGSERQGSELTEHVGPAADIFAWGCTIAYAANGVTPLSIVDLLGRVRDWLATAADVQGRQVAVTHPAVIRAAVVTVLDVPPAAFWRIDVPPLTRVCLTGRGGIWRLRTTT